MKGKRKSSLRIKLLAKPKHYSPKYSPMEIERIVDALDADGRRLRPSGSHLRIPPRVLMAAIPYERILQSTKEMFANVLPERHYNALNEYLVRSQGTMYQKLVKRPICTGTRVELPKPRDYDYLEWAQHWQRILQLSTPKKDWDKIHEGEQIPRAKKPLDELMPRILTLSALQEWKVDLLKQTDKDITKVNTKALLYEMSPRVEELAKPKKVEDCSLEGTLRTNILLRFDKKLENELLKRRALAKMNYKKL